MRRNSTYRIPKIAIFKIWKKINGVFLTDIKKKKTLMSLALVTLFWLIVKQLKYFIIFIIPT